MSDCYIKSTIPYKLNEKTGIKELDFENSYTSYVWDDGFECPTIKECEKQRKKLEILLKETNCYYKK